jgi:hypothetical protein
MKKDLMLPSTRKLLEEFDASAQKYGWEKDQGSPRSCENAEAEYGIAKWNLERNLYRLSAKVRNQKRK